jgi:hypothetical protein
LVLFRRLAAALSTETDANGDDMPLAAAVSMVGIAHVVLILGRFFLEDGNT